MEEMGFPPPTGEIVGGFESDMEVRRDLDIWFTTIGKAESSDAFAAVAADPDCPFADGVASAILSVFGIAPNRLTMAYRFYENGEAPDEQVTFIRNP
jgi:hypothetical protein